jgi:hypothetical protein
LGEIVDKVSILTTTRLSEDVVLREDCEEWGKVFTSFYFPKLFESYDQAKFQAFWLI